MTSFEVFPIGTTTIKLMKTGESFTITQPEVNLHNYIVGTPYLWYKGDMICRNQITGDKAIVSFKPKGWTSKGDYQCDGAITDDKRVRVFDLVGLWTDHLTAINPHTKEDIVLAKRKPDPENNRQQYFFSKFVINLNHLTQNMLEKIAPTDSRLRPDLRAYEYGDVDLASKEKTRLEEKQRARKKMLEQSGQVHKPTWFDFSIEGEHINIKPRKDFFKTRETRIWPVDTMDLFNL